MKTISLPLVRHVHHQHQHQLNVGRCERTPSRCTSKPRRANVGEDSDHNHTHQRMHRPRPACLSAGLCRTTCALMPTFSASSRKSVLSHLATLSLLLLLFVFVSTTSAQYKPNWPSPLVQREIFVLNLEDGYFGCQVNESTDFLQLFELSKLCDGTPQCFQGSDEVALELKCGDRNRCHPKMPKCTNGVCLDNLCYCNDGFGGKGCDLPGK